MADTTPQPEKRRARGWPELSAVEFEELVYDLLTKLGFQHVDWRKGTGKPQLSPDSGRDLQAQLTREDPDGEPVVETWFVQVKHHLRAVNQSALKDAIAWAVAERPDVLLIVTSGSLTNPTKEWIAKYRENNRPSFRIRYWEGKKVQQLLSKKTPHIRDEEQVVDPLAEIRPGPKGDHLRRLRRLEENVEKALRM